MDTQTLPGMDVETVPCNIAVGKGGGHEGALRLRRPDRAQMLLRPQCLEELVTADHRVRTVWAVVERDLTVLKRAVLAIVAAGGAER
jgi:hypothetical protein